MIEMYQDNWEYIRTLENCKLHKNLSGSNHLVQVLAHTRSFSLKFGNIAINNRNILSKQEALELNDTQAIDYFTKLERIKVDQKLEKIRIRHLQ